MKNEDAGVLMVVNPRLSSQKIYCLPDGTYTVVES